MDLMNLLGLSRQKIKESRRLDIIRSFDVAEKDGHIYLLCAGYPVKEFRTNATVFDIIVEIDKARQDALRYNGMDTQIAPTVEIDGLCK